MKTTDFDYYLPEELIAQKPANPRDNSRLMVIDSKSGDIKHRRFYNLPEYLNAGDLLIFNDTRVMKARLYGVRVPSGSKIEILLLQRVEEGLWKVLVKPGRRMRTGDRFKIQKLDQFISGKIVKEFQDGSRLAKLSKEHLLESLGSIPLPPYIKKAGNDPERYQTVYSKITGSIAAPTAGLHFSKHLMKRLEIKGIDFAELTLHVGLGTFSPVEVEDLSKHKMDSEELIIDQIAVNKINEAIKSKNKICAIGTTTMRGLESSVSSVGTLNEYKGWTHKFIFPPYKFSVANCMVTNFHTPKSTLLMMISAFADHDFIKYSYKVAIKEKYNFYSYGDAMLIL